MKKYGMIALCVLGLITVRAVENTVFYDPFIAYFKGDYQFTNLPEFNTGWLLLSTTLRFWLNSGLSIAIVYFLFSKKEIVLFSAKVYVVAGLVFTAIWLAILVSGELATLKMIYFYVRRFLIQPLLVFILVPAIYYQQLLARNSPKR